MTAARQDPSADASIVNAAELWKCDVFFNAVIFTGDFNGDLRVISWDFCDLNGDLSWRFHGDRPFMANLVVIQLGFSMETQWNTNYLGAGIPQARG